MSGAAVWWVGVLVVSLSCWAAFYLLGMPLNAGEAAVVVGFFAVLGWLLRTALRRWRGAKGRTGAQS